MEGFGPPYVYMKREEIKVITYVNSKDAKLFELASAELGIDIDSVGTYLTKLAELKAKSPKYVRLPVYEEGHEDEEIFEIDANARTIKVPASFSKNGVGVVSDELAETVWFKINRYFDIKDFGLAAQSGEVLKDGGLHILIQWEAPDGAKGASWAYAIDTDTDEDFVYFGWALTAEHLTAKAGNIKFAVRILQYDIDGTVAYSFATQAATIAVKAGLSFDITDEDADIEIEEIADKISNRLMAGHIAYAPVFAPADEEHDYAGGDLPAYILDLNGSEAVLQVSADSPEDPYDAIAYKWYKKTAEDEDFVLIAADDAAAQGQFTPALTVASSGQYYVVIFGMREILDGSENVYDAENDAVINDAAFRYHTSVASTRSTICTIPEPVPLTFIKAADGGADMPKFVLLQQEPQPVVALVASRQVIVNPNTKENMRVGTTSIRLEKTATAEKDLDLSTAEFTEVEVANSPISVAINEETGAIDIALSAEGETEGERDLASEGYYKVTLINSLNGDAKETVAEEKFRAVYPAAIGTVAIAAVEGANNETVVTGRNPSYTAGDHIKATVDLSGMLSDGVSYQWYESSGGMDALDAETPNDALVEGATGSVFIPAHQGTYYVRITNHVENTVAVGQPAEPVTIEL